MRLVRTFNRRRRGRRRRARIVLACCVVLASPGFAREAPPLVDVARGAGIDFHHVQSSNRIDDVRQVTGSGVCVFDFNTDGVPDIYFVNGSGFSDFFGRTPWWSRSRTFSGALYRNNGDSTFTDITAAAGLDAPRWGMGCAAADSDNDGDPDLYLTAYGRDALYRNNGDGTFTDITATAGLAPTDTGWTTGAAWADYDNDGWLDLYVTGYVAFDKHKKTIRPNTFFAAAPSRLDAALYEPLANTLYHNNGDGTFSDVTLQSRTANPSGRSLDVAFRDLDADGDPDLYVFNHRSRNALLVNRGDGTFADLGDRAVLSLSNGAAGTSGDVDGDGRTDLLILGDGLHPHQLLRNADTVDGVPSFEPVADPGGFGGLGDFGRFSWGVLLADLDNDGDLDAFLAQGAPLPDPDNPLGTTGQADRLLIRTFPSSSAGGFRDLPGPHGGTVPRSGRGAALLDYDGDGDLDIAVNNNNGPAALLENRALPGAAWLDVRLVGVQSNRDGVGAEVRIGTAANGRMQPMAGSSTFLSHSAPALHFGLGDTHAPVRVSVRWPSGRTQVFEEVPVAGTVTIREDGRAFSFRPALPRTGAPVSVPTPLELELLASLIDDSPVEGEGPPPAWLTRSLAAVHPSLRAAAVSAAGRSQRPDLVEPVMAALADPDTSVRLAAATVLAEQLRSERSILRATLFGKRDAVVPLLHALSDTDPRIRTAAVTGLGYAEVYRAVLPVAAALGDPESEVRRAAAAALGWLRDRRAAPRLKALLADPGGEPEVRAAAFVALRRLGDRDATSVLLEQMTSGDLRTRLGAVATVATLGGEMVMAPGDAFAAPLAQRLHDADPRIRQRAATALARLPNGAVLADLMAATEDSDPETRAAAVLALAEQRNPDTGQRLVALLDDPDPRVARAAVAALARLPVAPQRVRRLATLVDAGDNDADLRADALRTLGRLHPAATAARLAHLSEDSADAVRAAALEVLGRPGAPHPEVPVLRLTTDPVPAVRSAAATALGRRRDPRAAAPLAAALRDPDAGVRAAAATALTDMGHPEATRRLRTVAGDPHHPARVLALAALGAVGEESDVAYLATRASDPEEDPAARRAAVDGLRQAGAVGLRAGLAALDPARGSVHP